MESLGQRPYYFRFLAEFQAQKHLTLISGPRQSGKTSFVQSAIRQQVGDRYFNFDDPAVKAMLVRDPLFFTKEAAPPSTLPQIAFDEIHKFSDWKDYLKGIFDGYQASYRFVVTGSGRLDMNRKRGDALAGRTLHFRLFPFTLGELHARLPPSGLAEPGAHLFAQAPPPDPGARERLRLLLETGPFPEPHTRGTAVGYNRWASTYHARIVRDDIRSELAVRELDRMEILYELLPDGVGSPLSASSLAQTVKISPVTAAAWLDIFERFMLVFRIRPFHKRLVRSLVKEPKLYFYDYRRALHGGPRFENLVALELYRAACLWTDWGFGNFQLHHVKNREGLEVDFLVSRDGAPFFLVEAKQSDPNPTPALLYFQRELSVPALQLLEQDVVATRTLANGFPLITASAADFLAGLG